MNKEAKLLEANHLTSINRFERANEILFDLLSENPDSDDIPLLIGINYFSLSKYEEAKKFVENSLASGYEACNSHALLGLIEMRLNKFAQAETHFLESLQINPQNPQTIAHYSSLMFLTNHQEKGRKLLEEARRIDPEDEVVLHYWYLYALLNEEKTLQTDTLHEIINSDEDEYVKLINILQHNLSISNYKEAYNVARDAYLMNPSDDSLLDLLKNLKIQNCPFMMPIRMIDRLGGGMVVWGGVVALLFVLIWLNYDNAILYVAVFYMGLCVYSWVVPPIIKKYYLR